MSLEPIFVSFATPDYAPLMARLAASLAEFSLLSCLSIERQDLPWHKAQSMKAAYVEDAMGRFPSHPIVWVDADAIIRKEPTFLLVIGDMDPDRFDISAYYFRNGRELLSGTVYFRNTDKVRRLVSEWRKRSEEEPGQWEQRHLQGLVESRGIKVEPLPPQYVQITDIMREFGEPVIEHFQASRQKKRTNP